MLGEELKHHDGADSSCAVVDDRRKLISRSHFALAGLGLLKNHGHPLLYLGHCSLWYSVGAIGEAVGRSEIVAKGCGSGRGML